MRLGKLSYMTEYETNPPQPGRPDPGAPEATTELPTQHGDAERSGPDAERSEPRSEPASGPWSAAAPEPRPTPAGAPYVPWTPPAPQAPVPPPQAPGSAASPWQPAYAAQSTWQQQPAPDVPGSGAPAYQPQPPIWAPPGGGPGGPAGPGGPGGDPSTMTTPMGMPGGPGMYGPGLPAGPGTYRPPSRAGRRLAAVAAVLALAVGSGVLGGWIALQADDDTPTTTVAGATNTSNNSRPAPVINRDDLANVAAAVQPSVVSIKTDSGEGSGVVYDDQGDIVTNNHVVASGNGDTVTVIFNDGKSVQGQVVNTDQRTDLAVVKVSNVSGLTPAKIGDSGAMRVGDTVIALGSPLGLEGTVTAGIISALDRTIQVGNDEQQSPFQQQQSGTQSISGLLQTDAPINPGNSGGALANTKGEVIGINNAIAGSSSGGNIGVGFAIPSNKVKNVADQLIKGQKVTHPFLGVSVGEATNGGALVSGVTPNSPAAKAGIQEGDVITKLGGKNVADADDLISAVQSGNVGDRLELVYTRNGEQKAATVTLADAS